MKFGFSDSRAFLNTLILLGILVLVLIVSISVISGNASSENKEMSSWDSPTLGDDNPNGEQITEAVEQSPSDSKDDTLVNTSSSPSQDSSSPSTDNIVPGVGFPRGMTVINNCGKHLTLYYGKMAGAAFSDNKEVPSNCLNGNYCDGASFSPKVGGGLYDQGKAIWLSLNGKPNTNFAARTHVEMNFLDNHFNYDISRVKGFNFPAKIQFNDASGKLVHKVVCMDVNCDDAFYICDSAFKNVFYPDYRQPYDTGYLTIEFCPSDKNTWPLGPYPGNKRSQPLGKAPYMCNCDAGAFVKPSSQDPTPGTIIGPGSDCGPIT